jgi:Domain of unknown function (DUF4340)
MKGKQLLYLVTALLVLGGAGLYLRKQDDARMTGSKVGMGQKVLGTLDINDVAGLRIRAGSNQLNVVREGDIWVVKERGNHAASFSTLSEFLRKLDDLKVTRPLELGPSRLAALDLVEPDKGNGVQVELLGTDGKALKSLLLGKPHNRAGEDPSPFGGGGMANGRYLMLGSDIKTVALVSDPLNNAETRPEEWLEKEFLKVEMPKRIELVRAEVTNSFTLSRTNEFGEWQLADAGPEEKPDAGKLGVFGSVLSAPTFSDVRINPDLTALGLDKPSVARITTTAGFTYEIKVGTPQANEEYPIQVSVTADLKKERTPAADEKPEDKEKLDKEFKEKLAKLEEKLKTEQAYSRWTYMVSKWTIDPILKNRSDLFADKKAEGAPGGEGGLPPGLNIPGLNLPGAGGGFPNQP